ncbi:SH3 domain-containing protein [Siccirubricoccus sp. KC 17139]|uniref:SH3 domain-containing protein n=1 Tax=Siccirubricoccus soli TaxID=2899147 RepID=A0ABT1DAA1_9PROT|nr:SH3 domain-containing protein [Siccirubricoccus soli]MCO6418853.1 SH3 domain-containing protein [Siccirubricoccus soli]MCP2684988.1 SH3 domain-containing protein [Siccirubricoccus soli]
MTAAPDIVYRLQRPMRAGEPGQSDPVMAALPPGWIGLRGLDLGQGPQAVDLLLHPRYGLALLAPSLPEAQAALAALQHRLEMAGFTAIYPGWLPMLAVAQEAEQPLLEQLEAGFIAQPRLDLPGGEGWVAALRRALQCPVPAAAAPLAPPLAEAGAEAELPEGWLRQPGQVMLPPGPPMAAPARPRIRLSPPLLAGMAVAALGGFALAALWSPAEPPSHLAAALAADSGAGAGAEPLPLATERPAPTPVFVPPPALPRVVVQKSANLRATPDLRGRVLRVARPGEEFSAHRRQEGWVQVGEAAPEGWIFGELLGEAGE